ncbi:hypothetical protein P8452_59864 [Trifolium repens]|nr:hypothetical protein P8452_59864 [Trifolium repens]
MNGNEAVEDVKVIDEESTEKTVYMWGYLPGASSEKAPILSPTPVRLTESSIAGDSWKDVCGGGCGFAVAISEKGKLVTWGSTDDENQSYLMSGKHGEIPGHYKLPTEASVVKAAAGWAHCAAVTDDGDVYLWGWKECVPSGKVFTDLITVGSLQKDVAGKQSSSVAEQGSPPSPNNSSGSDSHHDNKKVGEEAGKRRKISFAKQESDSQTSGDDFFIVSPSLVTFGQGVKITSVAVGGRHTLALSDVGQVWGWGYGGEGQLGLGSRVKMVSSPHLIPCIESASGKDRSSLNQGSSALVQCSNVPGSYVTEIACGGRHSAVITDAGAILTFGWGLHGQCGQGDNADHLRPTVVPSLLGTKVKHIAAGLWHTLCITVNGQVYAFGGNQFGQLGTGNDQPETLPRLLDTFENNLSRIVSCGARHSALLTDDGYLFSWGWNKYGQLGLGDSVDRNIPCRVSIPGCRPRNVACGWWHTLLMVDKPV